MNARSKHVVGGVHLVGTNDGVEEVDKILILLVRIAIAGDVESRRAGSMLRKLLQSMLNSRYDTEFHLNSPHGPRTPSLARPD